MTRYIYILGLAFLFFACEQIIDLRDPGFEEKLTVYASIRGDSIPTVFFTKSKGLNGWIEQEVGPEFVTGLHPMISDENNSYLLEPAMDYEAFYYWDYMLGELEDSLLIHYYVGTESLKEGQRYQLSLEYGDHILTASTSIPSPVEIDSIQEMTITVGEPPFSYERIVHRIYFKDPPGEDNFYRIWLHFSGLQETYTFDPIIQDFIVDTVYNEASWNYWTITDENQDGQQLYMDLDFYPNFIPNDTILPNGEFFLYHNAYVQLESQGSELGTFFQSITEQQQTGNDPFTEPVFIKGNVENGYGVFGGTAFSDSLLHTFLLRF